MTRAWRRTCGALLCVLACACGARERELARCWPRCGDADGGQPDAAAPAWQGRAGSDFGPQDVPISWGSAAAGGLSRAESRAGPPSLALDAAGVPLVAWLHDSAQQRAAMVVRFDGERFDPLGGGAAATAPLSSGYASYGVELSVSSSEGPTIAFSRLRYADARIQVLRLGAATWLDLVIDPLGGTPGGDTPPTPTDLRLALTPTGQPIVAWQQAGPAYTTELFAVRYEAGAWTLLPGCPLIGGALYDSFYRVRDMALSADRQGRVLLAWPDRTDAGAAIFVRRHDGAGWQEVGAGSASGAGLGAANDTASHLSMTLSAEDEPLVAWQRSGPATEPSAFWSDIYVKRFDGARWVELGAASASGAGVSQSDGQASWPSLQLDGLGRPVLAWSDRRGGAAQIYLRRFDGQAWAELPAGSASGGGVSATPGDSSAPDLASAGGDRLFVAWLDNSSGRSQVYLKAFDGERWSPLGTPTGSGGGLSASAGLSTSPVIALDAGGDPVVAWVESSAGAQEIYLRALRQGRWQELPAGSATGRGLSPDTFDSTSPVITLDPEGRPAVAWINDYPTGSGLVVRRPYMKRFDGAAWVEVAGSASGTGIGALDSSTNGMGSIRFDSRGRPWVSWAEQYVSSNYAFLMYADGDRWHELGGSATAGGLGFVGQGPPRFVLDAQDLPVVAWQSGSLVVERFDGAAWVEVGAGSATGRGISSGGRTGSPDIARAPDGALVVAWHESAGDAFNIYVKRYDGASWAPLGQGAASAGGVSDTGGDSEYAAVAVDQAGRVVVAWREAIAGRHEIYARRFDGARWVEIGPASASGGGVSNSEADSGRPSLAVGADQACITWSEPAARTVEVVLRCARLE